MNLILLFRNFIEISYGIIAIKIFKFREPRINHFLIKNVYNAIILKHTSLTIFEKRKGVSRTVLMEIRFC